MKSQWLSLKDLLKVKLQLCHTKHQLSSSSTGCSILLSWAHRQACVSCFMHYNSLIPASDFLPPQETWCKHLKSHYCLGTLWSYYKMAWIKEAIILANQDSELCRINKSGDFVSETIISTMGCSSLRSLFPWCCTIFILFYCLNLSPLNSSEAGPGDNRAANLIICYLLTLVKILLAKATATKSFCRCCLRRFINTLPAQYLNEQLWDLISVK